MCLVEICPPLVRVLFAAMNMVMHLQYNWFERLCLCITYIPEYILPASPFIYTLRKYIIHKKDYSLLKARARMIELDMYSSQL
jgi:hypothetical protein